MFPMGSLGLIITVTIFLLCLLTHRYRSHVSIIPGWQRGIDINSVEGKKLPQDFTSMLVTSILIDLVIESYQI